MLTAAAVAKQLGISARAVYDLAASGRLPAYRFGPRTVRFAPEDVRKFKADTDRRLALPALRHLKVTIQLYDRCVQAGDDVSHLAPIPAHWREAVAARYRRSILAPWADRKKVAAFYVEARRLTAMTGVPHHVDHIIPLCGDRVSGLHVETNLQVLPAAENVRKFNRFEDAC